MGWGWGRSCCRVRIDCAGTSCGTHPTHLPASCACVLHARPSARSGVCLIKLGRPGEAMEHLGRCVELDGSYVKGYLRRAQAGVAMDDKEHIEGAIRDFNRAQE